MYYCDKVTSGTRVRFKLSDMVCPEVNQFLGNVTGDLELSGKIVYLSDSGEKRDFYAVVEVQGVTSPLIVPVSQIENLNFQHVK